jgi:hemerythrin superfamily protein
LAGNRNAAGNVALICGGVALGLLGSRVLPPLVASAFGSVRARKNDDPFDELIQDHREIESCLDRMENTPADSTARRMMQFLMLKRKLAKHAMAEEDVVYPILKSQADNQPPSEHMYEEHADMKIALFELENMMKSGKDWSERVRSLRDLIQHHVQHEESDVFPRLRQLMDQERRSTVSGQISREEAMVL